MICMCARAGVRSSPASARRGRGPRSCTSPAVGSIRRSTGAPSVDLPQPDSPTSPSVSPAAHVEGHAVDRLAPCRGRRAPKSDRSRTGKCLTQRARRCEQRRAHADAAPARAAPSSSATRVPARQRSRAAAAPRAGSARRRTGSAARSGSRPAAPSRLGTMPSIAAAAPARVRERGIEPAGRACTDAAAARTARSTGACLDDLGPRTSPPLGRPSRRPRRGRG